MKKEFQNNLHLTACIILLFITAFASAQTVDTTLRTYNADNANIQYSGRVDFTDPIKPRFSAPGVYVQAKFIGTSVTVILTDQYLWGNRNFYQVIIDGKKEYKLEPVSGTTEYKIGGTLAYGEHHVMVVKRTESALGYCEFYGFKFTGTIQTPNPKPSRKLQFIGNSISCGSGNEAANGSAQCSQDSYYLSGGWGQPFHNAYKAFGPVTARILNAEYHLTSVSGIGLIRNYDGTYDARNMQEVYNLQYLESKTSPVYDVSKYIPDVVVIELGTNDFSTGATSRPEMDSVTFSTSYITFIDKLKTYYPNAHFVIISSPMMGLTYPPTIILKGGLSMVERHYKELGDNTVHKFYVTPRTGGGCGAHPDTTEDRLMAQELAPFIKQVMSWNCATPALGNDMTTCGASYPIVLNSNTNAGNNIAYKWYKDNVLLSSETSATYSINSYNNAAGTYKVTRDSIGCSSSDEIVVSNIMPTPNLGDDVVLCNPATAVLDAGLSGGGMSYVWKKNSTVMNGATSQTLSVTTPGTYSVDVSSSGCATMTGTVSVTSDLLTVSDNVYCQAGQVKLTASGGTGTYDWYSSAISTTPLASGANYNPTISANTTYYVKDAGGVSYSLGLKDQNSNIWYLDNFTSTETQVKLIIQKACILSKLAVYPYAAGTNITIRIMDGTTVVGSKTLTNSGTGKQFIQLDLALQPGTYIIDAVGTSGKLNWQYDGNLPIDIAGIATLTFVNSWNNVRYGFYYDLELKTGNTCQRTPVNVMIDGANPNCIVTNIQANEKNSPFSVYPNPASQYLFVASTPLSHQSNESLNKAEVTITNSIGQIILTKQLISLTPKQLNISELQNGIYFYSIKTNSATFNGKFIKE